VSFARLVSNRSFEEAAMRAIGLDIHRDFCEVAIAEGGRVRAAGRIGTAPAEIEAFAGGLRADDTVTLEATGNALAIVRILEPHARVVLANPKATKAATRLRAKTDRIDARTLAQLLASGFLPEVWVGDEATHALRRRVGRRVHLVRQRTKAKNQVHAVLLRNLAGRPPVSDVFGTRGRAWLEHLVLPLDERETLEACLRTVDFLDTEVARIDRALAPLVLASPDMRRLLTLPGVSATTAATLAGVIGDIGRFPTPGRLVAYIGLDPRVSQSGNDPAHHGRISKQGASEARHVLVEAAWVATRTEGPLRAFAQRLAARRGWNIAIVAVARKLTVIAWHMLTRGEDYAFARPLLVRAKLREIELRAGAPRARGRSIGVAPTAAERRLEHELAAQAEAAYERLVRDWVPSRKQVREPPTGRASHDAERQPTRQGSAPTLRFGSASLPHQRDYAPDPGPRQDGT
jgi:transposase